MTTADLQRMGSGSTANQPVRILPCELTCANLSFTHVAPLSYDFQDDTKASARTLTGE